MFGYRVENSFVCDAEINVCYLQTLKSVEVQVGSFERVELNDGELQ